MEIEIRAMVKNTEEVRKDLDLKATHKESSNEHDLYLRHEGDVNRVLVLRIRRKKSGAILTFKGKSTGDDTAWADADLPLTDPDNLEKLLLASGYVEVVEIKKHRESYNLDGFEVNFDEIENLGTFIEIEGRGEEDARLDVEEKMMDILVSLGIQKEDIIRKGYVPLMLEKMAL
jgi:predicted adenylyl cyclase CyaB